MRRGLALAGRAIGHCISHALLLDLEHFGVLRLVRMLRAGVDLELAELGAPELVVGEHAAHGVADDLLGAASLELGVRLALDAAGIARVVVVHLLLGLVAGHDDLLGVDDDDEVAGVDVGRVDGLALAAQAVGDDGRRGGRGCGPWRRRRTTSSRSWKAWRRKSSCAHSFGSGKRARLGRAKGDYSESGRAAQHGRRGGDAGRGRAAPAGVSRGAGADLVAGVEAQHLAAEPALTASDAWP